MIKDTGDRSVTFLVGINSINKVCQQTCLSATNFCHVTFKAGLLISVPYATGEGQQQGMVAECLVNWKSSFLHSPAGD